MWLGGSIAIELFGRSRETELYYFLCLQLAAVTPEKNKLCDKGNRRDALWEYEYTIIPVGPSLLFRSGCEEDLSRLVHQCAM